MKQLRMHIQPMRLRLLLLLIFACAWTARAEESNQNSDILFLRPLTHDEQLYFGEPLVKLGKELQRSLQAFHGTTCEVGRVGSMSPENQDMRPVDWNDPTTFVSAQGAFTQLGFFPWDWGLNIYCGKGASYLLQVLGGPVPVPRKVTKRQTTPTDKCDGIEIERTGRGYQYSSLVIPADCSLFRSEERFFEVLELSVQPKISSRHSNLRVPLSTRNVIFSANEVPTSRPTLDRLVSIPRLRSVLSQAVALPALPRKTEPAQVTLTPEARRDLEASLVQWLVPQKLNEKQGIQVLLSRQPTKLEDFTKRAARGSASKSPDVYTSTLTDYVERNELQEPFSADEWLAGDEWAFRSEEEIEELCREARRNEESESAFVAIELSRIGMSRDGTQAMITLRRRCGAWLGEGTFILEWNGSQWKELYSVEFEPFSAR